MIRYKKITVSNFFSFGKKPTVLNLDTKNARAIMGVNEDIGEKGMSANGVGKSAILNAILYALFGNGIEKLKADEYINISNEKNLVVELEFETLGVNYKVRRGRKPNFVELYAEENGEYVPYTLDAMRNTDEAIQKLVGSYDIFITSYYLSPHRKSFMSMSAPEQRAMIEDMLSLNVLAERAEATKLIRSDLNVDIKVIGRDIENAESVNKNIHSRIQTLMNSEKEFDETEKERLETIRKELTELKSINIKELRKIFSEYQHLDTKVSLYNELINKHEKNFERLIQKKKHHDNLVDRLETLEVKLKEFDSNKETKKKEYFVVLQSNSSSEVISAKLEELEKENSAIIDSRNKMKEFDSAIRLIDSELKNIEEKLINAKKERSAHLEGKCHVCGSDFNDEAAKQALNDLIDSLNEKYNTKLKEKDSLLEKKRDSFVDGDIVDLAPYRKTFEKVKEAETQIKTIDDSVNPYIEQLENVKVEIDSIQSDFTDSLDAEIMLAELSVLQSKKDLEVIRSSIDEYVEILGSFRITKPDHIDSLEEEIKFKENRLTETKKNPFTDLIEEEKNSIVDVDSLYTKREELENKEKHAGFLVKLLTDSKSFIRRNILDNYIPYLNKKINEHAEQLGLGHVCEINSDLSVDILYMNKPVSYYNLSRGERLRLDIATTVAFRSVMGLLGKGCNLMLVDEVFDSGLDYGGVMKCLKFVKDSAETVLLITHKEELASAIESKITITKRNGFSELSE